MGLLFLEEISLNVNETVLIFCISDLLMDVGLNAKLPSTELVKKLVKKLLKETALTANGLFWSNCD